MVEKRIIDMSACVLVMIGVECVKGKGGREKESFSGVGRRGSKDR
jgi:hypothetical protein